MRRLDKNAEMVLEELLENRLENGKCDITYWKQRFEDISDADALILRNIFKQLKNQEMIFVTWADNMPYRLEILSKGSSYFDDVDKNNQSQASYVNNFYGTANNVQIQQGGVDSSQLINRGLDKEELIEQLIEKVKKYDSVLDEEYGENAKILRNNIEELKKAVYEGGEKSKIRKIVGVIRDLSMNVVGGLVAAGIIELASKILG